MKSLFSALLILAVSTVQADNNREDVMIKMRHLRAQINAMDAQRELMQVNFEYLGALGRSLHLTAEDILPKLGPGIPEHQQGLAEASALGQEIATMAAKEDIHVLEKANMIRHNCAACHAQENPAGGVDWDNLFAADWDAIAVHCAGPEKNPYLCKSMNGMLSAYGYLLTAKKAGIQDFRMTRLVADELTRVLADLKLKKFTHLSEVLRSRAETDARELSSLAAEQNPEAFVKINTVTRACNQCHQSIQFKTMAETAYWANFSFK